MGKKILIVDSEQNFLDVMELLIKTFGYEVIKINNSEEALRIVKQEKVDGIVLDSKMPKMSGYMVVHLLKNDISSKNIPILLLTRNAQMAGSISLKNATPYHISKPFQSDEFINAFNSMMNEVEPRKL